MTAAIAAHWIATAFSLHFHAFPVSIALSQHLLFIYLECMLALFTVQDMLGSHTCTDTQPFLSIFSSTTCSFHPHCPVL